MTLYQLLVKVKNSEPVNFPNLVKKLPGSYQWDKVFKPNLVAKNKYFVEVIDKPLFAQLLAESIVPLTRAEAASHSIQSSHSVKCDTAFKLFYTNCCITQHAHPQVITFVDGQLNANIQAFSSKAILIENQDCFLQYQNFLKNFKGQIPLQKYDIIFSAGKQILDARFKHILSSYEQVLCVFDYDMAGLTIFTSLIKTVNHNSLFLLPDNILQKVNLFTLAPKSSTDLLAAIELSRMLGLENLASIFESKKCFMEQEALLHRS